MEILEVSNKNKDFKTLCEKLQEHQYKLLPGIEEKGYSLTNDLDEVITAFLLKVDGKMVGSIALKKVNKNTCEIVRVYIEEEYRGQGHSKKLFERAENRALELGFLKAQIIAWNKAEVAVSLYKKLGYKVYHEGVSEWYGNYSYVELEKRLG